MEVEERAEFLKEKNNFCIIKFGGYHLGCEGVVKMYNSIAGDLDLVTNGFLELLFKCRCIRWAFSRTAMQWSPSRVDVAKAASLEPVAYILGADWSWQ